VGAAAVGVGEFPELDVLAREGLDLACCVDDAGARRARADVDADVVVLGTGGE
jgi:hypothetical protein